jgi:hypothetical protein
MHRRQIGGATGAGARNAPGHHPIGPYRALADISVVEISSSIRCPWRGRCQLRIKATGGIRLRVFAIETASFHECINYKFH